MSAAVITIRMDWSPMKAPPKPWTPARDPRSIGEARLLLVFLACLRRLLVVLLAFVADAGFLHFLAHAFEQVAHAVRRLLRGLVEAVVGGVSGTADEHTS